MNNEYYKMNLFEKLYIFSLVLLFLKGYNFFYFWSIHIVFFIFLNLFFASLMFLFSNNL
jgi:hypothetical protein